jgi:hypothetical protein
VVDVGVKMLNPVERVLAENHITPHRGYMRDIFANYPPYDAVALLGYLIVETRERFPPEDQAQVLRWLSLDAVFRDLTTLHRQP